jgi:hypothetical protein
MIRAMQMEKLPPLMDWFTVRIANITVLLTMVIVLTAPG